MFGIHKKTAAIAAAVGFVGTMAIPVTAMAAATQNEVVVEHSAYMISAPRRHSARIALEQTGQALTLLSGGNRYWYHVSDSRGHTGYITTNRYWTKTAAGAPSTSTAAASTGGSAAVATRTAVPAASNVTPATSPFQLPPGVRLDRSITPVASTSASRSAKANAVLSVAQSKLGTPYIWGHNEDRGQYGFDCSNFTEYVYHHALGYRFTTSSRSQATSVGTPIPVSQMQPGDLIIFDNGRHVGIYAGNGQAIQEGGGLGKVGYLSVGSRSYWGRHITAVKRMF